MRRLELAPGSHFKKKQLETQTQIEQRELEVFARTQLKQSEISIVNCKLMKR